MTQEEKTRAYDIIIEKANKMHSENCEACKACIEELIPELAESEDEKMMKEIINYFRCQSEEEPTRKEVHNKWIAWLENIPYAIDHEKREGFHLGYKACLEKQGEKKPQENKGNIEGISPNWSEEDEEHIDSLLKRLDALCRNKFERTRFAISEDRDWLKSLRPQNRWKPSDEQIAQLQIVIDTYGNEGICDPILTELLFQLKKLRGNV